LSITQEGNFNSTKNFTRNSFILLFDKYRLENNIMNLIGLWILKNDSSGNLLEISNYA
jgi:hypothetical protein